MRESFNISGPVEVGTTEYPKRRQSTLAVRLAVQGGGGLCAFSGGVCEAFARDPSIKITEATGLSGGGANLYALNLGGPQAVRSFWRTVGQYRDFASVIDTVSSTSPLFSLPAVNRYLYKCFLSAGVPTVLDNIRMTLKDSISNGAMMPNPIKLHITTARKKDPEKTLERSNIEEVIYSGSDVDLNIIMASCALEELAMYEKGGCVTIDGVPHWDGIYAGNNPSLSVFDPDSVQPVIVVSVDDTEVRTSKDDKNIIYGPIHENIHTFRNSIQAPVYHITLPHGDGISDALRQNPSSQSIKRLLELGNLKAQECLYQIKQDYKNLCTFSAAPCDKSIMFSF